MPVRQDESKKTYTKEAENGIAGKSLKAGHDDIKSEGMTFLSGMKKLEDMDVEYDRYTAGM